MQVTRQVMQAPQRLEHERKVTALEVTASALVAEQGVAGKQHVTDAQAARARRMTGRVQPGDGQAADLNLGALLG